MHNPVTTSEAATMLSLSPRWIARLVERGDLTPAHKLPGPTGAYLFELADVEALKAERATK